MNREAVMAEAREWLQKMSAHSDCCGTPIVRDLLSALQANEVKRLSNPVDDGAVERVTHPEAQGNKDLGEPAASGLEGKDDRLWALLRAEMEKFGLTYIGAPPTGKTRDESLMLAAMSAMRAWALLQAQRVAQAAPTSPQPINGESEAEKAERDLRLFGTAVMRDGKHIPLEEIYLTPEETELESASNGMGLR